MTDSQFDHNDHDLLVAIKTTLDIYLRRQDELEKNTREEFSKVYSNKADQADVTSLMAEVRLMDTVKTSKSEFKSYTTRYDEAVREHSHTHEAIDKRMRGIELKMAMAAGGLVVLQIAFEVARHIR